MRLEESYAPIREELRMVDRTISAHLNSDNAFIRQLNQYVANTPGKRLRPALVLLSGKRGDCDLEDAIVVGAAVEMIHTASLIHDDVVDDSGHRRGQPTVNFRWSNGISVILGDCWYSTAIAMLSRCAIPGLLEMLLKTVDTMCAAELEHLERCYDLSMEEGEYIEIVEKKTASLMSFCCKAGALVSKASTRETEALMSYGLNLGIAFQIVDDCLDIVAPEERTGKPAWKDLSTGKVTIPLIHAMNHGCEEDRNYLIRTFASREIDGDDVRRIRDIVKQGPVIERSLAKGAQYAQDAKDVLQELRDCESGDALSMLADCVVKRGFASHPS